MRTVEEKIRKLEENANRAVPPANNNNSSYPVVAPQPTSNLNINGAENNNNAPTQPTAQVSTFTLVLIFAMFIAYWRWAA
jgi:hypothetical protein